MVPQLRRENSLLLWNVFDLNTPVHTFVGHDDVVLEFQWRKQKEGGWGTAGQFPPAPVRAGCMIEGEDVETGRASSGSQGSPAPNCRWVIGCAAAVPPQAHLLLLRSVQSLSCLEGASKRLVALLLGHFQS